jgi:hypothetical protein
LCRRPVLLTELTATHFCSIPMFLQPTLLISQERLSRRLGSLLRATGRHGFHVRNGKLVDVFSAIAVYLRELSDDIALDSLEIALPTSSRHKPVLNDVVMNQIAGDFQAKLLSYRLHNLKQVSASTFDVPTFSQLICDHARTLGACVSDATIRSDLTRLLREDDEDARAEETVRLECVVLEAILFLCHEENRKSFLVEDVTVVVNTILTERQANLAVNPRRVGAKMKVLGFHTERLGSRGRGLVLTETIRRQAHHLARSHNLASTQIADGCPQCESKPI